MTLKVELAAEVEAGLIAQAQASGLSLEEYAARVLEEKSKVSGADLDAKARAFELWARGHSSTRPALPPEALRRENLVRTPK